MISDIYEPALHLSGIHQSLANPLIGGMNFLNEIMSDYPSAISFAPGAPHLSLSSEFNMGDSIDRFLNYKKGKSNSPVSNGQGLREYGPSQGIINDLIAQALSNDNVITVDPKDIVVTVGAQEAILLALRALFKDSGQILVVSDPCYIGIVGAALMLGIEVVPVSEGSGGLDLEHLRDVIVEAKKAGKIVRAVYVAPDFANPSGELMSLGNRQRILKMADEHDLYLLEDSAYAFTQDESSAVPALKTLDAKRRVVLIGTFSKIALPGIRVGYAVADQRVMGLGSESSPLAVSMATLKSMVTVNTSPICQAIAGGLLLGSGCSMKRLGQKKAEFYRGNLAYMRDRMDYHFAGVSSSGIAVSWNAPTGGFFVRVKLPVPVDRVLLQRCARDFNVVWTPMRQFCLTNAGDYEMRLSCSYLNKFEIDAGLQNLARFLLTVA